MKAVRLHEYDKRPVVEGQWAEKSGVTLPYTIGHENAGWVRAAGSAVTNVQPGDTVILHPLVTCGLCRACRAGNDVHCVNSRFPGIDSDGGMAELLLTSARSVIKLDPKLQPADVAALANAGLTAYHAVRKAVPRCTRARLPWSSARVGSGTSARTSCSTSSARRGSRRRASR